MAGCHREAFFDACKNYGHVGEMPADPVVEKCKVTVGVFVAVQALQRIAQHSGCA
jgi:hypothetical protein